jgi:hypothetical protein
MLICVASVVVIVRTGVSNLGRVGYHSIIKVLTDPSRGQSWVARSASRLRLGLLALVLIALAGEGLLELLLLLEVALALLGVGGLTAGLALLANEVGHGTDDREDALEAEPKLGKGLLEVALGLVVVLAGQRGVLLGPVGALCPLGLLELLRGLAAVRDEQVLGARGAGALRQVLFGACLLGHGLVLATEERHGV